MSLNSVVTCARELDGQCDEQHFYACAEGKHNKLCLLQTNLKVLITSSYDLDGFVFH